MPYTSTFRTHASLHQIYEDLVHDIKSPVKTIQTIKHDFTNSLVSNIYVSDEFVKMYPIDSEDTKKYFGLTKYKLYKILLQDGYLSFDNCENPFIFISKHYKDTTQEHVIPANELLNNDTFENIVKEENYFNILCNVASICIVTKDEDAMLNKKCKSSMPSNVDLTNKPFARYDKNISGIDKTINIYGYIIINGQLKKKS